jgi:hypothetical protein
MSRHRLLMARRGTQSLTVSDQSFDYGSKSIVSSGGFTPVAAVGTITSVVSIDSGNGSNHFEPAGTTIRSRVATDTLSGVYTLGVTFSNGTITDTATITVTAVANQWHVRNATEFNAAVADHKAENASVPMSIVVRDACEIRPWNSNNFKSMTNTAVLTIKSEVRRTGKLILSDVTTTAAAMTDPKYLTFQELWLRAEFVPTVHTETNVGLNIATSTSYVRDIVFDDCIIESNKNDIGINGVGFRGIIRTAQSVVLGGAGSITIQDCTIRNGWRLLTVGAAVADTGSPGNVTTGTCIVQRNEFYNFGADALVLSDKGMGGAQVIDNIFHSPSVEPRNVYGTAAIYAKKTGGLTGAVDSKKMLLFASINFVDAAVGNMTLYDQGGRTVFKRLSSGLMEFTARDSGGVARVTLTSVNDVPGIVRCNVLISVDTDGTSRMAIHQQGADGTGTWTQEDDVTAGGETLDFTTGDVAARGTRTGTELFGTGYMFALRIWHGIAPDITSAAVQALFTDATYGMPAELSLAEAAYDGTGSRLVDLCGTHTAWNAGTQNRGSGGTFTKTGSGSFDIDHPDFMQGIPGPAGRTGTSVTAANPAVVTCVGHGFQNGDKVTFLSAGSAPPAPLAEDTRYYVINRADDTFQVALTAGGAAINTSGGVATSTAHISFIIRNIVVARNVCVPGRTDGDAKTITNVQCIFLENIGAYSYQDSYQIYDNLLLGVGSGHGISLYNPINCQVYNNTCGYNTDWYVSGDTRLNIALFNSFAAGEGWDNQLRNNVASTCSISANVSPGSDDTNNVDADHLTVGGNAWSALFDGPFTPTTVAAALLAFKAKAAGPLLTVSPNVGAVGTGYADFDANTSETPLADRT